MSYEDHLRQQTQDQYRVNPNLQKIEPYQAPDAWTAGLINAEIENQRRRDEEARRNRS